MRGDARRFREHCQIGVDQPEARRGHHLRDGAQEDAAVRTPITRIRIRKMPADVALAEGAEHGVAERVNHHVPVRVGDDAACVGDSHSPSIT